VLCATSRVPIEASWTLRVISAVVEACSSTAIDTAAERCPTSAIAVTICSIAVTVSAVASRIRDTCSWIRWVAWPVWLASALTSPATTAKPLPASPARAASMVAFSASRLVCSAIVVIRVTTLPISSAASFSACTMVFADSALTLASVVVRSASATCRVISWIDADSCSAAAATVWALAEACSVAAATAVVWSVVASASCVRLPAVPRICSAAAATESTTPETWCSKRSVIAANRATLVPMASAAPLMRLALARNWPPRPSGRMLR